MVSLVVYAKIIPAADAALLPARYFIRRQKIFVQFSINIRTMPCRRQVCNRPRMRQLLQQGTDSKKTTVNRGGIANTASIRL